MCWLMLVGLGEAMSGEGVSGEAMSGEGMTGRVRGGGVVEREKLLCPRYEFPRV